jgi:hypothetical protein
LAVVVVTGEKHAGQPYGVALLLLYVPMHLIRVGFPILFRNWQTRSVRKVSLSSVGLYTITLSPDRGDQREYPAIKYEHGAAMPCLLDADQWAEIKDRWVCPF